MISTLVCFELSRTSAPAAIRERVASVLHEAGLQSFQDAVEESVVLKTCGRFEWIAFSNTATVAALQAVFSRATGLSAEEVDLHVRVHRDSAVALHLFRVAAGLESPIPGETHVLGQVRDAFLSARDSGSAGAVLSALFQSAIHAGRRVRNETGIVDAARGYAEFAVDRFRGRVPKDARILIIGSGRLAFEIGELLSVDGTETIQVVSRHRGRGESLAQRLNGVCLGFDRLTAALQDADVAVFCTSSAQPLVAPVHFTGGRSRLLVDLGMPRNVDPRVGAIDGVELVPLDDLIEGDPVPQAVHEAAAAIVVDAGRRFESWLNSRRVASLVRKFKTLTTYRDPVSFRDLSDQACLIRFLKEGVAA